jgi:hypothetical protein
MLSQLFLNHLKLELNVFIKNSRSHVKGLVNWQEGIKELSI